jgi:hypothetical protein
VVKRVGELRKQFVVPLVIEPNSFVRHTTKAIIDGVIPDSPAANCGLKYGDTIIRASGYEIHSRMHAISMLRKSSSVLGNTFEIQESVSGIEHRQQCGWDRVVLEVERGSERFEVTLDRYDTEAMKTFPYAEIAPFQDFSYGLVLTDCLPYSSLKAARDIITKRGAKRVLVVTSAMFSPILKYMLDHSGAFEDLDVSVLIATNNYFGGTVNIADLLVVQDFVDAIRDFMDQEPVRLDLVLIPSSPFSSSPWGRDLTGRPWHDIERAVRLPVELIPCPTVSF